MKQTFQRLLSGAAHWWIPCVLIGACVLLLPPPASGQVLSDSGHYLTDLAESMSDQEITKVERLLYVLEQRTQIEFRVVIVPTIGGQTWSTYTQRIFKEWNIGAKSGKGLLLLIVTRDRSCGYWTSKQVNADLSGFRSVDLCQEAGNEIVKNGFDKGVPFGVNLFIDELGGKYSFSRAELEQASTGTLDMPPSRPANPPFTPSFWFFLKPAFGVAISIIGVVAGFSLAISLIGSLASWKNESVGRHIWKIVKTAILLSVVGALLYHFWDYVKFHLRFGRLLAEGVAIFGSCLFPIFAILAFILLLYVLKKGGQVWAHRIQSGKHITSKALIITFCFPLLILVLPRSEVSIVRSWERMTGAITQVGNAGVGLTGIRHSSFVIDDLGRVTALLLRRGTIRHLNELPGIEKLASLETLDIEDVPLADVVDVSALTSLRVLRLSRTQVTGVVGLENLRNLEELEIVNVNLDLVKNFEHLPKLKRLTLTGCTIPDLSRIGSLDNLGALYLDGTNVTDVTPLSDLEKLTELSVADTVVENLRPVQHLPILIVNIRGTNITREQLQRTFKGSLIVVDGELGLKYGILAVEERFVPPAVKSQRNLILTVLAGLTIFLWLLSGIGKLQTFSLYLFRRIFSRIAWGVVLVVLFLNLANLKLPIYLVAGDALPHVDRMLINWAWFIAIIWLGLRPLLLLGLETRFLNSTAWSVPAQFGARFAPLIAVLGPISFKLLSAVFPVTFAFISIVFFLFAFVFLGLPWLIVLLVLYSRVRSWQSKLRDLRKIPSMSHGWIVEVPWRSGERYRLIGGVGSLRLSLDYESGIGAQVTQRTLFTVASAAMLHRMPTLNGQGVAASVITLQRRDLVTLKKWEIRLIRRWVESVYYGSWGPIWLISDWIETLHSSSTAVQRNLASLDSLLPYLSGSEHHFKIGATVFPLSNDESVQQCLAVNEIVSVEELKVRGLDQLLTSAFTPVAVLLRTVFGYAEFADRMDVLTRTTEFSIAFFALALTAEYDSERERFSPTERETIQRGLTWTFRTLPMFADWVTLLSTFAKSGKTELGLQVRCVLDEPAASESVELQRMLETAAGAKAIETSDVATRRQSLALLTRVRNLLVAHGPVIERASLDLYRLTLIVTLDLLTALPWAQVQVCTVDEQREIVYRGLKPQARDVSTESLSPGVCVRIGEGENERCAAAQKYFHSVGGSIAMFIGEEGFFDPLTGLRV